MRVKPMNKYVYNLHELLGIREENFFEESPVDFYVEELEDLSVDSQIATRFPEVFSIVDDTLTLDSHCRKLLEYLFNDHAKDIVLVIDKATEPTNDEVETKFINDFLFSLTNCLNANAPRYKTLLDLYQDKEDKLLDGIKSTTTGETRFNDTPQNDGEFDDDSHNTNITKTKGDVVSDGLTPMQRLKEVQEAYRNLIEDWAKEFRMFFIAPSNYEVEENE